MVTDRGSQRSATEVVVVANRLPVQRVEGTWQTSPGGLVRAMLGVLRDNQGTWVGWDGDTVDDIDADDVTDLGSASELHELHHVNLVRVPLTANEFMHHYERISNGALWPLFHDAIRDSTFDSESWSVYRAVNRRFAEATARAAAPGATVWIHDYQLLLVPSMLRELRPDVAIGFFLHIPFPPQELFMRMPWREEVLHGVLGADLVGFQRRVGAENFVALTRRLVEARVDDEHHDHVVLADGRVVHLGAFPISIDVDEITQIVQQPGMAERAVAIRERLGNPTTVFLGVDRLDYTKGIDLRLSSFGALLRLRSLGATSTEMPPDVVLVQIAVPGREGVESYIEERQVVERLVGEVNGEHAAIGHPAVHYIRRGLPLEQLVPLYMAADVMLVTPRRDGMNLVAKEFVAARRDDSGVLILSEFAGASDELTEAIVVNPHDPEAILTAMQQAIDMAPHDVSERMSSMRKVIAHHDVQEWARSFMRALTNATAAAPGPDDQAVATASAGQEPV